MRDFQHAREFQAFFREGEHRISKAQRDRDGWTEVEEWQSRARLYNRYVIHMRVAIEVQQDGTLKATESPNLDIIEVKKVEKSKHEKDGPKYEVEWFRSEEGAWAELVGVGGDLAELGFPLITDRPIDRFDTYWNDADWHSARP